MGSGPFMFREESRHSDRGVRVQCEAQGDFAGIGDQVTVAVGSVGRQVQAFAHTVIDTPGGHSRGGFAHRAGVAFVCAVQGRPASHVAPH